MSNSGTIKKVVIDGVTYDVHADAKASFNRTDYDIEGMPTTGDTVFKYTKRVPTIEGIDLALDPSGRESLAAKADSLSDLTLAVTWADGSVDRATGRIKFEKWESDSNKGTVNLIPKRKWTPFLAK